MQPQPGKEQLRQRLQLAAREEVKRVISALPAPVRIHATSLPVLFEMKPQASEIKEGIEPETLGLFTGSPLSDSLQSAHIGPTEITIFIENIWNYVKRDSHDFRVEVRRTYLHELGHFLGLDELDLAERDLD